MALLLLVGGLGGMCIGWWLWPTGITDLTIASVTLGALLKAVGSIFGWVTGGIWSLAGLAALAD